MLVEYPTYLQGVMDEEIAVAEQVASDNSNGDPDVADSIRRSLLQDISVHDEVSDYFYQAMTIIIMSYFDCLIEKIYSEAKPNGNKTKIDLEVDELYTLFGCRASESLWDAIDEIKEFRKLRNDIDHNNSGTPRYADTVREISKREDEIHYYNGIVYISGPNYLLRVLEKEHTVLSELATFFGYSSIMVSYLGEAPISIITSRIIEVIEAKHLKNPRVQINSWERIREWLEIPNNRHRYISGEALTLPVDKKEFKHAFQTDHPTPSGRISGADDTVINMLYYAIEHLTEWLPS